MSQIADYAALQRRWFRSVRVTRYRYTPQCERSSRCCKSCQASGPFWSASSWSC